MQHPGDPGQTGPGRPADPWARPEDRGGYPTAPYPPMGVGAAPTDTSTPGGPGGPGDPGGPPVSVPGTDRQSRRPAGALAAGAVAIAIVSGVVGGVIGGVAVDRGIGGTGTGTGGSTVSAQPAASAPDGTVTAVAETVLPSVVDIQVRGRSAEGSGSGIVLTDDGLILTNNHVVAAAGGDLTAEYVVGFSDGQSAPATLVAADPASDLAVLRTERDDLTAIEIGSSDTLTVGQPVVAIGSPLGLSGTVTTGIISAKNRPVAASGRGGDQATVIDALQTDAAINPGNSGGALVNMDGRLVGINTAIATLGGGGLVDSSGSIGLGFAIPVDQAMRIVDQLVTDGHVRRAQIGVTVPSFSEVRGAEVIEVLPGGPADRAGISAGSVIVRVGDRSIDSGDGLIAAVRSHEPDQEVEVVFVAPDGEQKTVTVTLGQAD